MPAVNRIAAEDLPDELDKLFLNHLSVSTVITVPVSRSDLPHLLQKEPDISVTSDKEQQDKNRRQTKVLLVAPGFVNTPDVIGAVLRHPEAKIRNMLKIALPSSLSKFPFEGNIYHIYGLVCFSDSPSTVDIQYTTLSQSLVLRTLGAHTQPVIRGQHQYYMVFSGCMLKQDTMKDWLRSCAKQKPAKKQHLTRKDLTRADIAKIHFVSMAGERSNHHPDVENFIAAYLKTSNEEIDKYNATIDKEKWPDLFA
nr:hypothetical protein BaRGS_003197 [Batillaria attramentaria]